MKTFGIAGWKNSGKTGLMERLVTEIVRRGLSVSTIKHAHHAFDIDLPGKDSRRHREAGAREVLVSSGKRWALMHELREEKEPPLDALIARMSPVDLVLIEGYKHALHPKLEVHRAETGKSLLCLTDPSIVAVASDVFLEGIDAKLMHLDDTHAIADLVLAHCGLAAKAEREA
jgi:molybdopterin-guanine dinucleotide biosynthesis protein MobB